MELLCVRTFFSFRRFSFPSLLFGCLNSYQAYLQALSKSGTSDMAEKAEGVLAEMERLHEAGDAGLKPDV